MGSKGMRLLLLYFSNLVGERNTSLFQAYACITHSCMYTPVYTYSCALYVARVFSETGNAWLRNRSIGRPKGLSKQLCVYQLRKAFTNRFLITCLGNLFGSSQISGFRKGFPKGLSKQLCVYQLVKIP